MTFNVLCCCCPVLSKHVHSRRHQASIIHNCCVFTPSPGLFLFSSYKKLHIAYSCKRAVVSSEVCCFCKKRLNASKFNYLLLTGKTIGFSVVLCLMHTTQYLTVKRVIAFPASSHHAL